jgi:DNA polymerase III subunit delta
MAEVKSHEFDGFLKRKPLPVRLFLVYGPDRGLVSERAAALAAVSGVDLTDAFSVVKLDAGEIGGQPGRLIDEMNAIGLFGGDRLVWIRNAGSEKGLSDALDILAQQPAGPSTLIIEAGDLKKGTGLRKVAESSSAAVAIACYPDDGRALQALIDQELASEGLRISPAARTRLAETGSPRATRCASWRSIVGAGSSSRSKTSRRLSAMPARSRRMTLSTPF